MEMEIVVEPIVAVEMPIVAPLATTFRIDTMWPSSSSTTTSTISSTTTSTISSTSSSSVSSSSSLSLPSSALSSYERKELELLVGSLNASELEYFVSAFPPQSDPPKVISPASLYGGGGDNVAEFGHGVYLHVPNNQENKKRLKESADISEAMRCGGCENDVGTTSNFFVPRYTILNQFYSSE